MADISARYWINSGGRSVLSVVCAFNRMPFISFRYFFVEHETVFNQHCEDETHSFSQATREALPLLAAEQLRSQALLAVRFA